ncbi:MAG TPA: hypothetical protein VGU72_25455 [Beijerinckiaceae bacterium]|jgi:hypothetical protein|nr:hypothetical protein [Beijerinckiaceae bacterium]
MSKITKSFSKNQLKKLDVKTPPGSMLICVGTVYDPAKTGNWHPLVIGQIYTLRSITKNSPRAGTSKYSVLLQEIKNGMTAPYGGVEYNYRDDQFRVIRPMRWPTTVSQPSLAFH